MLFHLYADDSQLYLAFNPKSEESIQNVSKIIHNSTCVIKDWMRSNFLKLNSEKTELLVITTPTITATSLSSLNICGTTIPSSTSVRDLGVHLDTFLKMDIQVRNTCRKAYYQLHLINKIRKFITDEAAKTLVQVNVISLLDYCNCLLAGLPDVLINKLQRVQNCAARTITKIKRADHITPALKELHWLPIKFRIEYKIILLTYKALNGLAPPYLTDLISQYAPIRRLRSSDQDLLNISPYRLKTFGGRSFEVLAPKLWNSLPLQLRRADSTAIFKRRLKTHFFTIAFT